MKRYLLSPVILLIVFSTQLFAQQHMQTEILGKAESINKKDGALVIKTKEAEARELALTLSPPQPYPKQPMASGPAPRNKRSAKKF